MDINYHIDDEDYSFSGEEDNDYEIVTRNYGIDLANDYKRNGQSLNEVSVDYDDGMVDKTGNNFLSASFMAFIISMTIVVAVLIIVFKKKFQKMREIQEEKRQQHIATQRARLTQIGLNPDYDDGFFPDSRIENEHLI